MTFTDVRDFIAALLSSGDAVRVPAEVDWDLEIGAISRRACEIGGPALWFTSVRDYPGQSVFANPLATWRRAAIALGLSPDASIREIHAAYEARAVVPIPPSLVSGGAWDANVRTGAHVDLTEIVAPMVHEGDGGRYIGTWDIVVSGDPRTGQTNWGTYRFMVHDERTLTGWPRPTSDLGAVVREVCAPRGEPLPVAIVIGADPLCHLAAAAPSHPGVDDASLAGGLRGEPVALARACTSDLLVPAGAEIVIQGTVLPDRIAAEGPYGEYSGYRTGQMDAGVLVDVTAIAFRDDPVHTLDCSGYRDSTAIAVSLTGAAAIRRRLQRRGIPVTDVYLPPEGAAHAAVIAVSQGGPTVVRAILETLTARRALLSKIFVVDADVDVFDLDEVIHAFFTRCHPGRGMHVANYVGRGNALTPYSTAEERATLSGATVAFDCTWPPEWDRTEQVPVPASFARAYGAELRERVLRRWAARAMTDPERRVASEMPLGDGAPPLTQAGGDVPAPHSRTEGGTEARSTPAFETFVGASGELEPGVDIALALRDLRPGRVKYLVRNVIARVARGTVPPDGYESLRVRSSVGNIVPGPWWIRVVGALPARLPGCPYSSVRDALETVLHRGATPDATARDPGDRR